MTKSTDATAAPGRIGRPRKAEVDRRILSSAMDVFVRGGWRDFSIDEVARRAGVGKASVYLRWADKADLLFDALSAAYRPWELAPGNSLRADLEALVTAIIGELSIDVGWAINRAPADPDMPPRLQALCRSLIDTRLQVVTAMIKAAKARGEIPADAPEDLIRETITGAATGHAGLLMFAGRAADKAGSAEYARRLVDFLYPALLTVQGQKR